MALRSAQQLAIDFNVIGGQIGLAAGFGDGVPFTLTRPCAISSSALRREAIPAAAMIFCNRSAAMLASCAF